MGSVIQRHGVTVENGNIIYDDRPSTFEAAEKLYGQRLDRRKSYAIIEGKVCEVVRWTDRCSGCSGDHENLYQQGMGCWECGYTGKSRRSVWSPLAANGPRTTDD